MISGKIFGTEGGRRAREAGHPAAVLLGLVLALVPAVILASANPDGSFSHSIPIKIPAGRNGMQPSISINYNSNGGNGELGVGWSVGGFGAITRGRADGGTPKYDGTDTYYLNGQKLIAAGSGQYRTEVESWQRVVASGTCGDGPCSFTVTDSSGTVSTYGDNIYSQVLAVGKNGSVRVWAFRQSTDLYGNGYGISYAIDATNGDYNPSLLRMWGPGVSAYDTVSFSYQTRTDVSMSYSSGSIVKEDQLLTGIEVRSGAQLQRKYVFGYDNGGRAGASRLLSAQECGTDGTTCFPAQRFGYAQAPESFVSVGYTIPDTFVGNQVADINGDGKPDLIQLSLYPGVRTVWLNNGTNAFAVDSAYTASLPGMFFSSGTYNVNGSPCDMGTRLQDVNGDGKPDLIQLFTPSSVWYGGVKQRAVYLNTGTSFAYSAAYSATLPDMDFSIYDASGCRDAGTKLQDLNGDGLPDLIQIYAPVTAAGGYGGVSQRRVYLNTGSGWVASPSYANSLPTTWFAYQANNFDLGAKLADLNGDGLPDIIQLFYAPPSGFYGGVAQNRVFLNTGTSFVEAPSYAAGVTSWFTGYAGGATSSMGTQIMDINGDGMADLIQMYYSPNSPSSWYGGVVQTRVWLSTGSGFVPSAEYESSMSGLSTYLAGGGNANYSTEMGTRVLDVNGDGLPDLVQNLFTPVQCPNNWYGQTNQHKVFLNNGHGFVSSPGYAASMGDYYFVNCSGGGSSIVSMGTQAFTEPDGSEGLLQLYDATGSSFYGGVKVKRLIRSATDTMATDRVVSVLNGLGGVTGISYEIAARHTYAINLAATYPSPASSGPRYLVTAISTTYGGSTYQTTYSYGDNRYYQSANPDERRGLGFRYVKAVDTATGNTRLTCYAQGPGTPVVGACTATGPVDVRAAGLPLQTIVRDASGSVWSQTDMEYEIATGGGTIPVAGQKQPVREQSTTHYTYDPLHGGLVTQSKSVPVYDTYGRVASQQEYVDGSSSPYKTTTTDYGQLCSGALLAVRPTSVTVTAGSLTQSSTSTYNSECKVASTTTAGLTTSYSYDTWGNVASTTAPNGAHTSVTYVGSGAFAGILPETVTNELGHQTTTVYDAYGHAVEVRDANYAATGLAAVTEYDALHRPTQSGVKTGSSTQWRSKNTYTFLSNGVQTKVETLREDGTLSNVSIATADALGRTTQTQATYDDGAQIRTLYSCTQYDGQGRAQSSLPSFDGCSGNYITKTYDTLGRTIAVTFPDGRLPVSYDWNGLTTTVTTGTGGSARSYTTTQDTRGRTISRSDPGSATITYGYDDMNRLTSLSVAGGSTLGSTLSVGYDSYGRKSWIKDQNVTSGNTTTYSYYASGETNSSGVNNAGLLKSTVDANNKTVRLEYDILGRPTKKCYGTTCTGSNAEVTVYDNAAGAGKGKVFSVTIPAIGNEVATYSEVSYDARGRLATTRFEVRDELYNASTNMGVYVTKLGYNDVTDSPTCAVLPDGSVMKNEYSVSSKNLKKVRYWDYSAGGDCSVSGTPLHEFVYSSYDEKGHVGKVEYVTNGNTKVTSLFSYEPYGALKCAQSVTGTSSSGCASSGTSDSLEHQLYTYDSGTLDLAAIADKRTSQAMMLANVNTDRSRTFGSDSQGRLTSATGGPSGSPFWSRTYAYSTTGNLTSKYIDGVQRSLSYSGTTQKLTSFGSGTYTYDSAGNVTYKKKGSTWWRYSYNSNNMITMVEKSTNSGGSYTVMEKNTFIGEQRIKKDYLPNDGSHRVRTYYAGGGFETRVRSSDGNAFATAYINGPSGRMASLTRQVTNGSEFSYWQAMASYGHYAIAGMQSLTSLKGIAAAFTQIGLGFVQSSFGRTVFFMAVYLSAFIFLVLLASLVPGMIRWVRERRGAELSGSGLWNPALARTLSVAFGTLLGFNALFVGCNGYVSPSSELVAATLRFAADGHTILNIRNALTGDTTGGPPPGSYFTLNNHVGSNAVIVHAVDQGGAAAGTVASLVNYEPYGEIDHAHSPGQDVVTYKFTGQEYDPETSLYNFGARMYDTDTGRFLSADTVVPGGGGDSQGLNRYMYVRGNPVTYNDPTGHSWKDSKHGQKIKAENAAHRKEKLAGERHRFLKAGGTLTVWGMNGKSISTIDGKYETKTHMDTRLKLEKAAFDARANDMQLSGEHDPITVPEPVVVPSLSGGGWQASGARGEGFVVPAVASGDTVDPVHRQCQPPAFCGRSVQPGEPGFGKAVVTSLAVTGAMVLAPAAIELALAGVESSLLGPTANRTLWQAATNIVKGEGTNMLQDQVLGRAIIQAETVLGRVFGTGATGKFFYEQVWPRASQWYAQTAQGPVNLALTQVGDNFMISPTSIAANYELPIIIQRMLEVLMK